MSESVQTKIAKPKFDQIKFDEFLKLTETIYGWLSTKMKDQVSLSQVIKDKSNLKENLNEKYLSKPESFTRENIINPILNYLNFDPGYRVSESDLLKVFGRRHPDYKLIVNSNTNILVEAEPLNSELYEKPGKGLHQVYEWLEMKKSKTDYGIVTDGFEWTLVRYSIDENKKTILKTINIRPFFLSFLGQKVAQATLQDLHKEFMFYFSRDSVENAITGFIKFQSEKREKISKKFYEEYLRLIFGLNKKGEKTYHHSLYDAIKNVDNEEHKKRIAQINVDRIIFVKFIESKGWINDNSFFLRDIKKGYEQNPPPATFFKTYLEPLFFDALNNYGHNKPHPYESVRYLNGGLFRRNGIESQYPNYDIPDAELFRVIDFLESYEFKIKGEETEYEKDLLDPEILGYIFERTANHEVGAYYTPESVTTYITKESLESLVLDRINGYIKEKNLRPINDIYSIFGENGMDIDHLRNLYEKRKILDIKILDPACGSGAFFIPIIRKLVDLHKKFFKEINRKEPDIYQIEKKIVEECIHGVDINEEAIEIAKLRLWLDMLNVVEDLNNVDSLPNIEYNIQTGNSLIGATSIPNDARALFYTYYHPVMFESIIGIYPDLKEEIDQLIKREEGFEMTFRDLFLLRNKLLSKYKAETHPVYAARLRDLISTITNKFRNDLTKIYFSETMNIKTESDIEFAKVTLKPFHWIMEFADVFERGGFDVIIGNPPYGVHFSETEKEYFRKNYITAIGRYDSYFYFIERAIEFIKKKGFLGYIIPDTWMTNHQTKKLRKMILDETKVINILALPQKVFPDATVDTCIIILQKEPNEIQRRENKIFITVMDKDASASDLELAATAFNVKQEIWLKDEKYLFNIYLDPVKQKIIEKILKGTLSLGAMCEMRRGVFCYRKSSLIKEFGEAKGTEILKNRAWHSNKKEGPEYKKELLGSDISRYSLQWKSGKWLKYGRFMASYVEPKFFENGYIAIQRIRNPKLRMRIVATYVPGGQDFYASSGLTSLIRTDEKVDYDYLLGLLNSKLLNWYFKQFFRDVNIKPGDLKNLPILLPDSSKQKVLINLVKKIINLTKSLNEGNIKGTKEGQEINSKIKETDKEIDNFVYEIYGLTEEEIKIVEAAMG